MLRVLGNFGLLLRGKGAGAIMLLVATALMARTLGPVEFGMVILMQTYVLLIRGLLNVKQFQGVIRYGVPALDAGDTQKLRRLVAVCRRVDLRCCLLAAALAVSLAPLLGPQLGMDSNHILQLSLYSLVLLSSGNVTDTGLLRLYDKFDVLGRKEMVSPALRLLGVLLAWWMHSPAWVFVAIFALSYVAENIYLKRCGHRICRERLGPVGVRDTPDASMVEFSGLRHFLWITYWQSNLDLVPKHVSVMLAGNLLGSADAGLLRLARQFSTLLAKPATLLRQVMFPDLTRSWNQESADFRLLAFRTAFFAGIAGLSVVLLGWLFGAPLLTLVVGAEYAGAAPLLTLLLLAATLELVAASLRSAAYASGHASKVLRLSVVAAIVYLSLFVLLATRLGLWGIGIATCAAGMVAPLAMALIVHRSSRRLARKRET